MAIHKIKKEVYGWYTLCGHFITGLTGIDNRWSKVTCKKCLKIGASRKLKSKKGA